MKILHVTNAVQWSGGMQQIFLLVTELQKRNCENIIVCPPGSELAARFSDRGVPIEHLSMFQDYDLLAAWRLKRLVDEHSPDIVHAHHPIAHAISLLALLGDRPRRPALIVSRRVSFPPRKNPFSLWKYRSGRIDRFVAVSAAVKETLVQGGIEPAKIHLIYSAVEPEKFAVHTPNAELKAALNIPEHSYVVGKIANFSRWKGQHIFLAAAKKCLDKNRNIIFLLAGKGTQSLLPMAERLGIEKSVRLLGFREDVPAILSFLHLSVNSAIAGEGLAGALRESLAMGIPVVSSDVAGNKEIVRDGETGLIFRAGDSDALAEKIFFARENQNALKAMGEKGRQWVLKHATVEKMADGFMELYSAASNQHATS